MRPEDLGIAPFTPEPDPRGRAVLAAAEDARVKVRALVETADAIERQHAALQSAYDRSQAVGQRLSVENFHMKRALEEVRRHRAVLFAAGLLLLALALLRR